MATNIILVDDHPLFRKGLLHLLEEQKDFRVVGEAGDGQTAIDKVRTLSPEVVIMDISMPDIDGIEATRQILSKAPSVKVIALSMHSGKRFVEDILQAGAVGYILKGSVPEDLVKGIRVVIGGDIYLSPAITGIVVSEFTQLLNKLPLERPDQIISPMIRTKFRRPSLSSDLVPRSKLVERFDDFQQRPLTLVSAAAGYGKSTLASLWLESWVGPCGWLSLDESDSDLNKFVNYLLEAISIAIPEACETTRSFFQGGQTSSIATISQHLVNDLDRIDEPFILVLDDYHKIRNIEVHDLISNILVHPPKNMHLIIVTRRDPPLLINMLRGRDLVNEIRTDDLSFATDETALFFRKSAGISIDDKTAELIMRKFEGWPAGIRMISRTPSYVNEIGKGLTGLKGNFPMIMDYLMEEVLTNEPPRVARIMILTSLLDCFCAPQIDYLKGTDTSQGRDDISGAEFIDRLKKNNMFLIPMDEDNQWYRYHHIFKRLLTDQSYRFWSPEQVATTLAKAETWIKDNYTSTDIGKTAPPVIKDGENSVIRGQDGQESQTTRSDRYQTIIDPLTNRELDILDLLAQRQSNSEIAETLFISVTTVKGHLQSIYSKLNVNKRRLAVEKAKALGILSQD